MACYLFQASGRCCAGWATAHIIGSNVFKFRAAGWDDNQKEFSSSIQSMSFSFKPPKREIDNVPDDGAFARVEGDCMLGYHFPRASP
jgi:hypothetical protein